MNNEEQRVVDPLDKFVSDIIDDKQLPGMNDDVRIQLMIDMKQRLSDQINRALIEELSEDKVSEFNVLLDDPLFDEVAMQRFFVDGGIDVTKVAAETMLRFRDLYINPVVQEEEITE